MGICNMTQGTQTEALQQPRGEGGGWEVQEFQEGEDIKKKKKKGTTCWFPYILLNPL